MSARTSSRQLIGAADDQHADIVSMDGGKFLAQIFAKQAHQKINFRFGAAPVFHGKSVERQGGNSEPGARFNHRASRLDSRAVTGHARQMAPLRPAAVSIHDDGNMLREPVRIQFKEQPLFCKVRGFERFRCFHATIPANSMKWTEAVSRAYWKANIGDLTAQHTTRYHRGKSAMAVAGASHGRRACSFLHCWTPTEHVTVAQVACAKCGSLSLDESEPADQSLNAACR